MPVSMGVTRIRRVPAGTGKVYIQFTDKNVMEFASPAAVQEWANEVDAPEARDLLRRLIVRWWLHRNPTGSDVSQIEGKVITLDLSGATLLEVRSG